MSQKIIKVALIQVSVSENITANISKLASKIREAASKGAGVVVLQELHNSLYFCQVEDPENFNYDKYPDSSHRNETAGGYD